MVADLAVIQGGQVPALTQAPCAAWSKLPTLLSSVLLPQNWDRNPFPFKWLKMITQLQRGSSTLIVNLTEGFLQVQSCPKRILVEIL